VSVPVDELSSTGSGMPDFKECLKLLRDGHPDEALLHIRRALDAAPKNPFFLSYAGLITGLAEQRYGEAEILCREALSLRHNHPQLYLNLCEVYQQCGRTGEAIEVLEKGFASTGRDQRIRRALAKVGRRRPPVFLFLDRSNPLNRILGMCRHRLLGPPRAA
jgi:predicted Zn-dependent protease